MELSLERGKGRRLNSLADISGYLRLEWRELLLFALPLLAAAIAIQITTGRITTAYTEGGPVKDLVLGLVRPRDLSFVFVWGYVGLIALLPAYIFLADIRMLGKTVFFFSLIVIVRGGFILLTGLRSPAGSLPVLFPGITGKLQAENDLFFSGHTAIPLMIFFVFRERKAFRTIYLLGSITLGATSLVMHRHYSIDVAAAPFICYGTYVLGSKLYAWLRPRLSPKAEAAAAPARDDSADPGA